MVLVVVLAVGVVFIDGVVLVIVVIECAMVDSHVDSPVVSMVNQEMVDQKTDPKIEPAHSPDPRFTTYHTGVRVAAIEHVATIRILFAPHFTFIPAETPTLDSHA